MAQTLNATLAASQLLTERKPLIEILSDKFIPDIPLTGQRLTSDFGAGVDETSVNAIVLSDGRLAILTTIGDQSWGYNNNQCRLTLSNPERTEFTDYTILLDGTNDAPIVELPDGNLGFLMSQGKWRIINVTDDIGTIMDFGTIGQYGFADSLHFAWWVSDRANSGHSSLIRLANGTYMYAYVSKGSDTYGVIADIGIRLVTSSNFTDWTVGAQLSIPTSRDVTHPIYNPFLFQTEDGTLNLLFEYVEAFIGILGSGSEKVNIYHYVSTNGGSTWSQAPGSSMQVGPNGREAGAITFYEGYTVTARHPYAIQLGAGNWRISYHEGIAALTMDTNAVGWEGTSQVFGMHFDPVSRLAYVVNYEPNGYGNLSSIVVVDPDTWAPVKSIDPTSGPTFSDMWWGSGGLNETVGERELVVVRKGLHIGVYNSETDQVTEFHFAPWEAYGVVPNITPIARGWIGGIGRSEGDCGIRQMFLDYENKILYLYWARNYAWGGCFGVGKIDLTQTGPEYTHDLMWMKNPVGWDYALPGLHEAMMGTISEFKVYPDDNLIVFSGGQTSNMEGMGGPWDGVTMAFAMNGDLVHYWYQGNSDTYPYRGIRAFTKIGYYIYGTFLYEPLYGNEGRRGLARISLLDFSVTYFRPTFSFLDNYTFNNVTSISDGEELLITSDSYGAAIFNVATGTWEEFNGASFPGVFSSPRVSAYDEEKAFIFLGSYNDQAIEYFNRYGFMNQPQYLTAVEASGVWSYGEHSPLLTPRSDKDLVMTTDPASSGGMYAFWLHVATDGSVRVRWDKDGAEMDLTDYLVAGSAVVLKRSIDGTPNKLSFSLTHGHLFDPHNTNSLWSPALKKYRRIRLRFGEEINGVPYWHDAGTFVILSTKLSHQRGTYPNISVECEDIRVWWEDAEIVVTDHYEQTPEQILVDVISTWGGMAAEDVVLPAMEGSYEVWFQWLDTTVKKVVDSLCGRFGYFPTITVDNKFTVRKISNANAVDHTYAGTAMLISFTPDDDFSDFTNRVTVTGESRDFIDVLYEEEAVGTLYGTSGWWGNKQTFQVWYSDDHKRKAKNPRLLILESCVPNSFISKLGGGSESIVSVDVDEFFCTVLVETPDMSTIAWTLGAAVLISGVALAIAGIWYYSVGFGMMVGWMILLSMLLYVLSGIVNWQYEIWARPFGQQRLGCSGQANDVDLQALLNRINEKKLDEPLAISPEQCQWIAEHELMVVMMQRNRVKFEKVAHLQDEEGDTIVVPHPYSGRNMTVFITDLTRTFHTPSGDGGEGGFVDSIDGWKVAPL